MRLKNFAANGLVFVAAAFFAIAANSRAADKKEWVTLNDCRYVDSENNDGDSFIVRCGEKEFTVRLYYVDTPETNLVYAERVRQQGAHFGLTLDGTLKIGEQAKDRVRALLQKPFVVYTRWAVGGGRAREGRFYAIVEVDGKSLGETLVSEGLALAKGTAPNLPSGEHAHDYMQRLAALEDEARAKRVGAWATASVPGSTPSAMPSPVNERLNAPALTPTPTPTAGSPYGEYPADYGFLQHPSRAEPRRAVC
jgi:endonuclease YncB( thermonuclease family)